MNKRKEYCDRINKLESEEAKLLNKNSDIYFKREELSKKRDKNMLMRMPVTCILMVIGTIGLYNLTNNPNIAGIMASLTGCSICGISIYDLVLGIKISKLDKESNNVSFELKRNENELEYTKELLESYEKQNSVSNERIVTNKANLVYNNNLVNNIVNTKGKVRTLSHKKANNIRK